MSRPLYTGGYIGRTGLLAARLPVAAGGGDRTLSADRTVGLLLSCNVVVRAAGDCTIVEALDPRAIADIAGQPLLKDVAQDAAARLRAALDTLPPER
jgi:uncharacterized protein (DUF302 family)